jgi:hypothetical protein
VLAVSPPWADLAGVAAKHGQLRAWIDARPGLAGADLGVRLRSAVFALLGLTTAACLAVVAILVHQGVPFLPSLPLPGLAGGDEHVASAKAVEGPPPVIAAARDRLASADAAADGRAGGDRGGPGGASEPAKAVAPGPSSAVAPPSDSPVAAPAPAPEPAAGGGGSPGTSPDPAPSPAPASSPPVSSTDAQLASGKSSKGGSGKRNSSSSKGEGGTDAAVAPSTKKSSKAPVSTPEAPSMTDAEPDPVTDADLDDGNGHRHRR